MLHQTGMLLFREEFWLYKSSDAGCGSEFWHYNRQVHECPKTRSWALIRCAIGYKTRTICNFIEVTMVQNVWIFNLRWRWRPSWTTRIVPGISCYSDGFCFNFLIPVGKGGSITIFQFFHSVDDRPFIIPPMLVVYSLLEHLKIQEDITYINSKNIKEGSMSFSFTKGRLDENMVHLSFIDPIGLSCAQSFHLSDRVEFQSHCHPPNTAISSDPISVGHLLSPAANLPLSSSYPSNCLLLKPTSSGPIVDPTNPVLSLPLRATEGQNKWGLGDARSQCRIRRSQSNWSRWSLTRSLRDRVFVAEQNLPKPPTCTGWVPLTVVQGFGWAIVISL